MSSELAFGDLTYKLIGLGMQVYSTLGNGYLERVYENSLMVLFRKNGIHAEQQCPIKVRFEGEIVGDYCADVLVDGNVLIELKVADRITDVHKAQVLNFLKATGVELGMIFNFGAKSFEHHRLINRLSRPGILATD
ncbi:MAG TPA: GxxExxY protein [Pyrinomonadaceae bacterium]|nr:GxxExxY protein [Pyrinomonadaceae bacterium]